MASETEQYLARIAQDRIPSTEEWQRRAREILELARMKKERRESVPSIWPGNTFRTEPIPQKPNNIVYNTLSDPKLNAGLENLISNASDAIFGRESGNSVVDLGLANAPLIGPASILAAGGVPGIVDVAGMGELRNIKKIPKYTYDFVKEFFGDRGLKAVDNALTKYPKAKAINMNDALEILKTGIGGDIVPALKPYRTTNVIDDLVDMGLGSRNGKTDKEIISIFHDMANHYKNINSDPRFKDLITKLQRKFDEAYENNNTVQFLNATRPIAILPEIERIGATHPERWYPSLKTLTDRNNQLLDVGKSINSDNIIRYARLDSETPQNWYMITTEQKFLDEHPEIVAEQARRAEEEALKSKLSNMSRKERKKYEEKLRKRKEYEEKVKQQEKNVEEAVEKAPEPEHEPEPIKAAEIMREATWDPSVRDEAFYRQFGSNLSPESKRDAFVVDSLANHWARQITGSGRQGELKSADIFDALSRADARHNMSTYDQAARGFREDVKKNLQSGNMPGTSVEFLPRFKGNVRVEGDTPTLLLRPEENPRYYDSPRIWADEQDGPDLYELVFRPKADEVLNSINPAYWLYKRR